MQGVSVDVTVESGEIQAVYDKEVVTVMLDNLISNSIKYTLRDYAERGLLG